MIDTLKGDLRVRKWPRARGKTRTKAQRQQEEWFAQVQRAANYVAPNMMLQFHEATQGTPLLPRDILTHILSGRAMMFELPDGRKMYPMIFRESVNEALDALSQTDGTVLVRTAEGWVGLPYGGGGSGAGGTPPDMTRFQPWSSVTNLPNWIDNPEGNPILQAGSASGSLEARGFKFLDADLSGTWRMRTRLIPLAPQEANKGWGLYAGNRESGRFLSWGWNTHEGYSIALWAQNFNGASVDWMYRKAPMILPDYCDIEMRFVENFITLRMGMPGGETYEFRRRYLGSDGFSEVNEVGFISTHEGGNEAGWPTQCIPQSWEWETDFA